MNTTPRILVDNDACPVKEKILKIGSYYGLEVVMFSSIAHYTPKQDARARWVFVDASYQNVDMALFNQARSSDIVVTQDYGLAALLLDKSCRVLHHKGFLYTKENIEELLLIRHLSGKIRRASGKVKGPKPMTVAVRERFESLLEKVVQESLQE